MDLYLACNKLARRDGMFNKSDPFCVVSERDSSGTWRELGRTEVINNNHGVHLQRLAQPRASAIACVFLIYFEALAR